MNLAFGLGLVAMTAFGISTLLYKFATASLGGITTALIAMAFNVGFLAIYFLVFEQNKSVEMNGFIYAAISGVIASVGMAAFMTSVKMGNVGTAATVRNLSFVITVILAAIFLAEKITITKIFGVGFATAAIILLSI